jgi:hypothetical protein
LTDHLPAGHVPGAGLHPVLLLGVHATSTPYWHLIHGVHGFLPLADHVPSGHEYFVRFVHVASVVEVHGLSTTLPAGHGLHGLHGSIPLVDHLVPLGHGPGAGATGCVPPQPVPTEDGFPDS